MERILYMGRPVNKSSYVGTMFIWPGYYSNHTPYAPKETSGLRLQVEVRRLWITKHLMFVVMRENEPINTLIFKFVEIPIQRTDPENDPHR